MNKPESLALHEPVVGRSRPHESAHLHVSGAAPYTDDLPEPAGTLHAALGLSPIAHGTLTGIDLDTLRRQPGVVAVLTAAEAALRSSVEGVTVTVEVRTPRSVVTEVGPTVSATVTRYFTASFEARMPPAGLTPMRSPVTRCQSRTVSSMSSVVGSVAAGCTFPVDVLMKSPPARMPSHDARLMLS